MKYSSVESGEEDCRSGASAKFCQAGYAELVSRQPINVFAMKKLEHLSFDNTFARLPDAFHRRLLPTPLPEPYLVSFNANAAELMAQPDIDGGLIGGASLVADEFIAICRAAAK